MRIADAMYKRKSIRNFMDNEIEKDILERLMNRLNSIELMYSNSKLKFVLSDYCKKSYFAPYYIGVYGKNTKEAGINAGYALEQLSIYLSAIGIGSCFQGKSLAFKPNNEQGEVLLISMAIGYPAVSLYRDKVDINRFKSEKICVIKEKPNKDLEKLIELARISPSAFNTQPWRFVVYNNKMHSFVKKGLLNKIEKYKYINIGAMFGNIALGAEEIWIDYTVKEVKDITNREYGDNQYITSIYITNMNGNKI